MLMLTPSPSKAQFRRNFAPFVLYDPYAYSPWWNPYFSPYNPYYGYPYGGGTRVYIYNPPAVNYTPPSSSSGEQAQPATRPEPRQRIQDFYRSQKATSKPAPERATAPATAPAQSAAPAHLEVRVPAEAEVWIDGVKTSQNGATRKFVSPDLPPGREYAYEVRVAWRDQGRETTETRRVTFRAGDKVDVDFTNPKQTKTKDEQLPKPKPGKP
jgi:uncharacterized protein (TIGR03000 family)